MAQRAHSPHGIFNEAHLPASFSGAIVGCGRGLNVGTGRGRIHPEILKNGIWTMEEESVNVEPNSVAMEIT